MMYYIIWLRTNKQMYVLMNSDGRTGGCIINDAPSWALVSQEQELHTRGEGNSEKCLCWLETEFLQGQAGDNIGVLLFASKLYLYLDLLCKLIIAFLHLMLLHHFSLYEWDEEHPTMITMVLWEMVTDKSIYALILFSSWSSCVIWKWRIFPISDLSCSDHFLIILKPGYITTSPEGRRL